MAKKAHIGNVLVHRGMPPDSNPYLGSGMNRPKTEPVTLVSGDERVAALKAFRDGKASEKYSFWEPGAGGQGRLTSPEQVDWETAGLDAPPTEKPTEKPTDKPADKPVEKAAEPAAGSPGDKAPATPAVESAEDKAPAVEPAAPVEAARPFEMAEVAFHVQGLADSGGFEQLARVRLQRDDGKHALFFVTVRVIDGQPQLSLVAKIGPDGRDERVVRCNGAWLGGEPAHASA